MKFYTTELERDLYDRLETLLAENAELKKLVGELVEGFSLSIQLLHAPHHLSFVSEYSDLLTRAKSHV